MADTPPELFTTEDPQMEHAMEGGEAAHTEHVEPIALGLTPGGWVGLAMLVFLLVLIWKGVHKLILGGLDSRIAAIKEQLEEARSLRAEAETLRDEYVAKIANAEKDAAAMISHAETEAEAIVQKAEEESAVMVARRKQMAEDKIASAERSAVEELRAKAANAAAAASRELIAQNYDAAADRTKVDSAIAGL